METSSTDFVLYDCIICGRRDITAVKEPIHATTSKKEIEQKRIDTIGKEYWYQERDSNPHGQRPQDFKSCVYTIPPSWQACIPVAILTVK